jgi:hypothetical protein
MAPLADGQYELDGALLFGNGTLIRVQQTAYDPGSPAVQDAAVVQGDGVRMGVDTMPITSITLTGIILAGNGQPGLALDTYEALAAAWMNEDIRAAPGAYSVLRIRYPGSPGTRSVFGRGRKIAPTLGSVRQGVIPFTAQFDCASPYFYTDGDSTLTLTMMPSDIAGVVNLHNRLLNTTFDADATQWQGTNCALAWNAANFHTAAGSLRVTPAGAVAGVYASGNLDNADLINPSRAYTLGLWALAPSPLSVQVQASIAWLNAGGAVISSAAGPLTTLPAGTWTFLPASGAPASGAVTADPRLVYAGSPAAADVVYLDDTAFIENIGGIAPPVTPPVVLGGTSDTANAAAVPGGGQAGARQAWPVITFTGPVTNPQLAYPATGQYMRLQTTLPAGVTATIDTRPWQRTILRSDGASIAGTLRGNPLRDMALQPGTTPVRFSGQDATGTARCTVAWRSPSGSIGGST